MNSATSGSTAREILTDMTVSDLKTLTSLLPTNSRLRVKADYVKELKALYTTKRVKPLLNQISELDKSALSETAHSDGFQFDPDSFEAKYGALPDLGERLYEYQYNWRKKDSSLPILRLFFPSNQTMPRELKPILKKLLPKPKNVSLETTEVLPAEVPKKGYFSEDEISPLRLYSADRTVGADLKSILLLIDAGRITVGEKTKLPSLAALRKISEVMMEADFLADLVSDASWEKLTPIRPFAWVLLILSAKLAKPFGKTLKLTRSGQKSLGEESSTIRKKLFDAWITSDYDEVMRNETIKGKTGRGKRSLTHPFERRLLVIESLKECPVDEWINIDHFIRFLRASGHNSLVAANECWDLYVSSKQYGSLGYRDTNYWGLLEGPWLRCLLMEYLATIGVIDIAYVDPRDARDDFQDHWGADCLSFITQYDGLLYFKLTQFGAYCLGLQESFRATIQEPQHLFVATSNLHLTAPGGKIPVGEEVIVELYCVQVSDVVWKLDERKILNQLESGRTLEHLESYLASRVRGDIPETMRRFIDDIRCRTSALSLSGSATIIQCNSTNTAKLIANDTKTKKFCFYAEGGRLVIPHAMEKKFRNGVKKLGYVVPL